MNHCKTTMGQASIFLPSLVMRRESFFCPCFTLESMQHHFFGAYR